MHNCTCFWFDWVIHIFLWYVYQPYNHNSLETWLSSMFSVPVKRNLESGGENVQHICCLVFLLRKNQLTKLFHKKDLFFLPPFSDTTIQHLVRCVAHFIVPFAPSTKELYMPRKKMKGNVILFPRITCIFTFQYTVFVSCFSCFSSKKFSVEFKFHNNLLKQVRLKTISPRVLIEICNRTEIGTRVYHIQAAFSTTKNLRTLLIFSMPLFCLLCSWFMRCFQFISDILIFYSE